MTHMGRNVNDLSDDELWKGDVEVTAETEKAILVSYEGEETWVPKSQVHDDSEAYKKGQEGKIVLPLWLAEREGWA